MAVWIAFFPVSLIFNYLFGDLLAHLPMLPRIALSTLILTPIMVCVFIPASTRLLARWLRGEPRTARGNTKAHPTSGR